MAAITNPEITLIVENSKAINPTEAAQIREISDRPGQLESYFTELAKLYPTLSLQGISSKTELLQQIETVKTDILGYIPRGSAPLAPLPAIASNFLAIWPPHATLPKETATVMPSDAVAWIASTSLVKSVLPQLEKLRNWTILEIANALEKNGIPFQWTAVRASEENTPIQYAESPRLGENSTVLAVVPHYRCEVWLNQCLTSLVNQTRSPDGIVVVDDGSQSPPFTLVQKFPQVTLLRSHLNVGPYRLIQQVINDTNYDAYLFQDADDWSTSDRLEKLLKAAAETGAELVGTQEFRVLEDQSRLIPACYPLNVNAALAEKPGHPLLHPTSLVARDLVLRVGGFATGLRFGGDTEFLLRAHFVCKIVNIPDYCYFRRKRANSLTTAPQTGLESPARLALLKTLKSRALANDTALRGGQPLCLSPLVKKAAIELSYVTGPQLH